MSSNPPPSTSSTKVQAPQSATGSLLAGRTAPSPINGPSSKPHLPLDPDNSTSMLMRWAYVVHGVTVTEKLQRDALQKDVTGAGRK